MPVTHRQYGAHNPGAPKVAPGSFHATPARAPNIIQTKGAGLRGALEPISGAVIGFGRALSRGGLDRAMRELEIGPAELWTLINVETRGAGYLSNRLPVILFERHIFSRQTGGRFDAVAPDISNPRFGGYLGNEREYPRLVRAAELDYEAALRSASWGLGQVLGVNAESLEYIDAAAMVTLMRQSENDQLNAVIRFLLTNDLGPLLRDHQWTEFARRYNGPRFADNSYDIRMATEFEKFAAGAVPNVEVRAVQLYLTYLNFDPRGVDGIFGARSRAAVADFLTSRGVPTAPDDVVEEMAADLIPRLESEAALLPDMWPLMPPR
ncbi:MAG: N-acetylmuramidase domain-containing protein [Alphaproteobacteria bacterium]